MFFTKRLFSTLHKSIQYSFSNSSKDFYKILGVSKKATKAEIKKAYA